MAVTVRLVRLAQVLCLAAALLFTGAVSHVLAAASLQDQYLQIFLMFQDAEKLESSGQKASAYKRYEDAAARLKQFKKDNPDWEPGIVNYRLKFAQDKLERLKGAGDARSGGAESEPGGGKSSAKKAPASDSTSEIEDTSALKQRISDLESELDKTKQELASVTAERDDLRGKLEATQKELADAKSQTVDAKMADLMAENADLKNKLSATEDELSKLRSGGGDTGVAALQTELAQVKQLLEEQKKQNALLGQTNAQLQQDLAAAQAKLAQGAAGANAAAGDVLKENEMMRGIIQRQLQEQARRDAARKLAQEELQTLQVKSDVLEKQITILSSPLVELSADERTLLRLPQTDLNASGNDLRAQLSNSGDLDAIAAGASTSTGTTTPADAAASTSTSAAAASGSAADGSAIDYRTHPRIPPDMRPLATEAGDLFAQRKFDEAAAKYEQMLQKYPDSLYGWSNLGVVRFQQQKYEDAKKALQEAIKLAPNDGFSHSVLGISYYQMGKYDDAITFLTRAAALEPNDAKTRNYLGISLAQKGWQEAAEKECRKAVELDPNYADAHFNLAVLYATQKPPSKEMARKHYNRALELGVPKEPGLEKMLGAK